VKPIISIFYNNPIAAALAAVLVGALLLAGLYKFAKAILRAILDE
jgi:divalent metal cation (Fe/Co/Zn/Cd) transporter